MAHWVADETGGDLYRVTAKDPYLDDYNQTADRAKQEQDNDERPEIMIDLTEEQMVQYDTVFFGFLVWWYDLPMSMWTFLESYDFSGKTIIPFFSHEGSSNGAGALPTIEKLAEGATVRSDDVLSIRGGSVADSEEDVREWVQGLGYQKTAQTPQEELPAPSGKTLVVYYSASGNTGRVAEYVADELGADTFEIIPVNVYSDEDLNWNNIPAPTEIDFGEEYICGFLFDNVLHSENDGDIHFGLYIPENYDGSEPYALYVTLPGYEELYFQGVGANIRAEDYGIEAQKYNERMIIIAPQLNDWRETSARQTIALTRYFLEHYNIDPQKVYLNGYFGGGETGSLVMEIVPELYTAFLHCSSQWDGALEPLAKAGTPIYMVTGENDSYYGSSSVRETYEKLVSLYKEMGFTEEQIN